MLPFAFCLSANNKNSHSTVKTKTFSVTLSLQVALVRKRPKCLVKKPHKNKSISYKHS